MSTNTLKVQHLYGVQTVNGSPFGPGSSDIPITAAGPNQYFLAMTQTSPGDSAPNLQVSNGIICDPLTSTVNARVIAYPNAFMGQSDDDMLIQNQSLSNKDITIRNNTFGKIRLESNELSVIVQGSNGTNGQVLQSDGGGGCSWQQPTMFVNDTAPPIPGESFILSAPSLGQQPINPITTTSARVALWGNLYQFPRVSEQTVATNVVANAYQITAQDLRNGLILLAPGLVGVVALTLPTGDDLTALIQPTVQGSTIQVLIVNPNSLTITFTGNTNMSVLGPSQNKSVHLAIRFLSGNIWSTFW